MFNRYIYLLSQCTFNRHVSLPGSKDLGPNKTLKKTRPSPAGTEKKGPRLASPTVEVKTHGFDAIIDHSVWRCHLKQRWGFHRSTVANSSNLRSHPFWGTHWGWLHWKPRDMRTQNNPRWTTWEGPWKVPEIAKQKSPGRWFTHRQRLVEKI